MVGQQVTVRLINGGSATCEATRRDIDILRHCGAPPPSSE